MASIFTYEPDPPRVASPWLRDSAENDKNVEASKTDFHATGASSLSVVGQKYSKVTRLEAEPQEGPVEYKLHLLLRPRRKFRSTSTGSSVSGSRHSKLGNGQPSRSISESAFDSGGTSGVATPPAASTQQTRQHRLEQLTTQLLWRLQQSSPHHTSSATNIILPSLPEALPELEAPLEPAKLLHGLEESHGALYEIGVSDDGTLVGLAEDEMHESLNNLRAMAACLGCTVEVLRKETVGDCEWIDDVVIGHKERKVRRTGRLVVVEALVKPFLQSRSPNLGIRDLSLGEDVVEASDSQALVPSTEQLRITLTGPTMSGKSSLLGTLTTSTLDNGRGKSRMSMLRHRHEINSGITSSVTQELLGYQDANGGSVQVINYATENIASWIDVHVTAAESRLVFISDSAGHPRYRRTTLRGLVGWAPHWTLLCIPADDVEPAALAGDSILTSQQTLGSTISDVDLSGAQLDLCLKLHLPLIIVITKLDLASKTGLKNRLTRVLDALKDIGRKPAILANSPGDVSEQDLHAISASSIDAAYHAALPLLNDALETVPIVLTSAVQGTGIGNLHALLHELPIPDPASTSNQSSELIFYVEDVYHKPAEVEGVIISGRLHMGQISAGDRGVIGPFALHDLDDSEDSEDRPARKPASSHLPTSRSFPGALRAAHLAAPHLRLPNQEWRRFKAISVRNLRLPVHTLVADQVGTIAIVPDDTNHTKLSVDGEPGFGRIKKGMILTNVQPLSTRSFVAEFKREDLESLAVGNQVVVYIASVRASARVVSACVPQSPAEESSRRESNGNIDAFHLEEDATTTNTLNFETTTAGSVTAPNLLVTLSFDASKEFVLVGDQVLVMPGGGPGLYGGHERGEKGVAGLDGFVGRVTETFA